MGVYINGMEMPTTPVLFCVHPDGKVFADMEGGWKEYKAVPVPPHGRCIDADVLVNKHFGKEYLSKIMTADKDDMGTALVNIPLVINNAPTIIPASGGKEYE